LTTRFGVGVVLPVLPSLPGQLTLGLPVQRTVGRVGAQPVAEGQHPVDLRVAPPSAH
jgi:hypothetical protein